MSINNFLTITIRLITKVINLCYVGLITILVLLFGLACFVKKIFG